MTREAKKWAYRGRLSESERRLWRTFVLAHSRIEQALDEELRLEHGLDLASVEVIYELTIAAGNQLRMADLAKKVVYTRSKLTSAGQQARRPRPARTCDRGSRRSRRVRATHGRGL